MDMKGGRKGRTEGRKEGRKERKEGKKEGSGNRDGWKEGRKEERKGGCRGNGLDDADGAARPQSKGVPRLLQPKITGKTHACVQVVFAQQPLRKGKEGGEGNGMTGGEGRKGR